MTPAEQAAAHDANFVEFFRMAATPLAGASQATYGTIPVVVTGVPAPFFNGAWLLESPSHDDLEAALLHLRGSGLPFILHVRSDLPDAARSVEPLGLAADGLLPCFAISPGPTPPAPPDLELRRVGPSEWDDFLATTAAGFGMPLPMVDALYAPAMLDMPGVRAFLGYADGWPVATSVSVRTGSTLGIYSIATVPEARGRGHGTAATWHLMRDADPGWQVAVLQASDMGRPIYERMGFQLVREFVEYVARPPA
jgi:ribosomal protein S18 acetylase RimI-like enzyme